MKVDKNTGLVSEEQLNQVIIKITKRKNGTTRIQQDFTNCPSMAEQGTAHLTDINYLIKTYKPDELAAYMAARSYRPEITGHDFAEEPTLAEARNITYQYTKAYEELPEELRKNFKNHVEFLKFIDNPANQEKMTRLGILKQSQIDKLFPPKPKNDDLNDDSLKGKNSKKTTVSTKDSEDAN